MRRSWWLTLLSVAACSPYNYSKEVTAVSSAMDQLSSAYTSGTTGLASDLTAQLQRELIDARAYVALTQSCGLAATDLPASRLPCTLQRVATPVPAPPPMAPPVENEKARADTLTAMAVLQKYVHVALGRELERSITKIEQEAEQLGFVIKRDPTSAADAPLLDAISDETARSELRDTIARWRALRNELIVRFRPPLEIELKPSTPSQRTTPGPGELLDSLFDFLTNNNRRAAEIILEELTSRLQR